jgi:hypothetical protein
MIEESWMDKESVHNILTISLGMKMICAEMMPKT